MRLEDLFLSDSELLSLQEMEKRGMIKVIYRDPPPKKLPPNIHHKPVIDVSLPPPCIDWTEKHVVNAFGLDEKGLASLPHVGASEDGWEIIEKGVSAAIVISMLVQHQDISITYAYRTGIWTTSAASCCDPQCCERARDSQLARMHYYC